MRRGFGRLFGLGSGRSPENELWDKLVSESEAGIREAGNIISGLIDGVGGLSDAVPEARFASWESGPPLEEVISGAERELEELCGRYDYRQLLYLSRLCTGVPALRDADADTAATRVRVQNADRWALRCGDRSSAWDFMRAEDGGVSVGALPEPIFRDAAKLHWLANFHQWRVIDRAMFNFLRLVADENGTPDPRLLLRIGGAVGREWGSPENWASVNLYAHRYRSQNGDLDWWAMGDAEPDGGPFTLTYGYSPAVTRGPYAGGQMFVPVELQLGAMMEYGRRFRANFERKEAVGMPPEHLRAISRGLARFAMQAAGDTRQASWLARSGMLAIPRTRCSAVPWKWRRGDTSATPTRTAPTTPTSAGACSGSWRWCPRRPTPCLGTGGHPKVRIPRPRRAAVASGTPHLRGRWVTRT